MKYLICRPDPQAMKREGYARVAYVPFLLGDDGSYPEQVNRYIRARALAQWKPRLGSDGEAKEPRYRFLTDRSNDEVAGRLRRFLDWCDLRGHRIDRLSYQELLLWQDERLDGTFGLLKGRGRLDTSSPSVTEAAYFLTWLAEVPRDSMGEPLRQPFNRFGDAISEVHMPAMGRRQLGNQAAHENTKRRRIPRRTLRLPKPSEVDQWLAALRIRAPVKALMAAIVLDSGMRISEINELHASDFPSAADWRPTDGRIYFDIVRGSKGPKRKPGSKESRIREVHVSIELARAIERYRLFTRETQIRRWIRGVKSVEERKWRQANKPKRMWLSEHTNQPFSNRQFHHAWTTTPGCSDPWHPHLGRHWFAVEQLVRYGREAISAAGSTHPSLTWLDGVLRNQVDLLLRPALGHIDARTTEIYLRAAKFRLTEVFGAPSLRWNDLIDSHDL